MSAWIRAGLVSFVFASATYGHAQSRPFTD